MKNNCEKETLIQEWQMAEIFLLEARKKGCVRYIDEAKNMSKNALNKLQLIVLGLR